MVNDVVFWAFVLSNAFVLAVGGALTYLSYAAYRRTDERPFVYAIAGFGVVTLGSLIELFYELLVKRTQELSTNEVLSLHTWESALIGLGLVLLFYSLAGPRR